MWAALKNSGTSCVSNKITIFTCPGRYNDDEYIYMYIILTVFFLSSEVVLAALFVHFTAVHRMICVGGLSNWENYIIMTLTKMKVCLSHVSWFWYPSYPGTRFFLSISIVFLMCNLALDRSDSEHFVRKLLKSSLTCRCYLSCQSPWQNLHFDAWHICHSNTFVHTITTCLIFK